MARKTAFTVEGRLQQTSAAVADAFVGGNQTTNQFVLEQCGAECDCGRAREGTEAKALSAAYLTLYLQARARALSNAAVWPR